MPSDSRRIFSLIVAVFAVAAVVGFYNDHPANDSPLLSPVPGDTSGSDRMPPPDNRTPIEPLSSTVGSSGASSNYSAGNLDVPAGCHGDTAPDRRCTPGAVDRRVTQATILRTICVPGWSASVRPPESSTEPLKRRLMDAYGYAGQSMRGFELDHLIPLEDGGAALDTRNLWPQRRPGSYAKDGAENSTHAAVCAGSMTLAHARSLMRHWR